MTMAKRKLFVGLTNDNDLELGTVRKEWDPENGFPIGYGYLPVDSAQVRVIVGAEIEEALKPGQVRRLRISAVLGR
jgi:hypothetical protein